jgi:predicted transcriptional regulator
LFISAILFLISCAVVFAQSSGNINVEVKKIDSGFSTITLILLGIVILLALVLSLIFLLRSRSQAPAVPRPKDNINLRTGIDSGFKKEGYYNEVFKKKTEKISDERSAPVEFIQDEKQENNVDRYLKEDERIIINVLRMKHNSCSQATLRVVTDFSKARLSRLLTELEERGVIYKEQQGRKNIITLKI